MLNKIDNLCYKFSINNYSPRDIILAETVINNPPRNSSKRRLRNVKELFNLLCLAKIAQLIEKQFPTLMDLLC